MLDRISRSMTTFGFAAVIGSIALVGLAPRDAHSACIAGTALFQAGEAGIIVKHNVVKLPHAVVVQQTNTAGYSPVSECTYFNVLKKKPDHFQVQHKTCADGTPKELTFNVPLDWILCTPM